MSAAQTLSTYGLAAFGVNTDRATELLSKWVANHPDGQERAAPHLRFSLESLLQKMEAVHERRSTGFRLWPDEAAVTDILIECGTYFNVRREAMTLLPA